MPPPEYVRRAQKPKITDRIAHMTAVATAGSRSASAAAAAPATPSQSVAQSVTLMAAEAAGRDPSEYTRAAAALLPETATMTAKLALAEQLAREDAEDDALQALLDGQVGGLGF